MSAALACTTCLPAPRPPHTCILTAERHLHEAYMPVPVSAQSLSGRARRSMPWQAAPQLEDRVCEACPSGSARMSRRGAARRAGRPAQRSACRARARTGLRRQGHVRGVVRRRTRPRRPRRRPGRRRRRRVAGDREARGRHPPPAPDPGALHAAPAGRRRGGPPAAKGRAPPRAPRAPARPTPPPAAPAAPRGSAVRWPGGCAVREASLWAACRLGAHCRLLRSGAPARRARANAPATRPARAATGRAGGAEQDFMCNLPCRCGA